MQKKQILLTNDDGIHSPGLWAAAEALSNLGYVSVAAPRDQSSGMGRSMPAGSDGIIHCETLTICGREWPVFAVGGTPAQVVVHAVQEIMPQPPDLVVSGINYGENVGSGLTISGTVGAAMQAADMGFPALAMSLETDAQHFFSYSPGVDFSVAGHFTAVFACLLLEKRLPGEVGLFKVDVPSQATRDTPWKLTRCSRQPYFRSAAPQRKSWDVPGRLSFTLGVDLEREPHDSDVYVLRESRMVSVTPLSLDFTARVDFNALDGLLRSS